MAEETIQEEVKEVVAPAAEAPAQENSQPAA